MDRRRNLVAVVGATGILVIATIFDSRITSRAQRQAAASFDGSVLYPLLSLGAIAVAGGCLLVWRLGSRAAPWVGLLYTIVGGLLALLPWLMDVFATVRNGAPTMAPAPVARLMVEVWFQTSGPLGAVGVIGGAMLLTGLVSLGRGLRARHAVAPATVIDSTVAP